MDGKKDNLTKLQLDKIVHQKSFVDEYPKQGTVGKTMKALGMNRTYFYEWIKDPEFNAVYQELKADRIDELVTRLYKFITDGKDSDDNPIKLNQQQLLAAFFLLKAFDPKTFTDKMQMQHTGADGAPVKVTTVEIHRAEKPDSSVATAEDMKETIPDGDTDSREV